MPTTRKTALRPSTKLSPVTGPRCGTSVADLKQSFLENLHCALGRVPMAATPHDLYTALALTVRDRLFQRSVRTMENYAERDARVVAYLSAEFLPGPHLANNLHNLGLTDPTRQAILNVARMGKFSADRSIRDYCAQGWPIQPA